MIVAGFGFRASASEASLRSALEAAAAPGPLAALAAPEDKTAAPAFRALAEALHLPVIAVAPEALAATETVTHSPKVAALRGTGSVAEAAALSAAGQGARLICPRMVSEDRLATCALAEGTPI
ncbi:MAG: cobalamin biosynthesis protein [Rhodobacteraceae bacterium]|nr:cobalamin biosynthesis protein [Paracoccaceae bacterium]